MIERSVKGPPSRFGFPSPAAAIDLRPARSMQEWLFFGLFIVLCAAYLALGAWNSSSFGFTSPDASSGTGVAAAMLWSRNPHYGALLTALPPLTTALQIPLVWIISAAFSAPEYSAYVLAAIAATGSLFTLYMMLEVLGSNKSMRLVLVLLFAANPVLLLSAVSGSSNALLMFCLLVSVYGLTCWWKRGQVGHLGLSGVAVTLAFLVSYWAILFVPLLTAAFLYGLVRQQASHPWIRITLFIMTPFYTLLFWLGFNFISMRDPLAFLNADTVYSLADNPFTSVVCALMYGLLAAFIVLVMLSDRERKVQSLWGYVAFTGVILIATIAAAGVTLLPGQSTRDAPFASSASSTSLTEEQAAGDYVRDNLPASVLVLLDRGDNYTVIEKAGHPERFVIPTDVDYKELVANAASDVDYILVQKSVPGRAGTIEHDYPMLYGGRWLYAQLERDFGGEMGWRLYRVARNAGK